MAGYQPRSWRKINSANIQPSWHHACFSYGDNFFKQTHGVAMGTKMGPSYANLFVGLSKTNFSANTTASNLNSAAATLTTVCRRYLLYQREANSIHNRSQFLSPGSQIYIPGKFPTILYDFETSKFQLKGKVYAIVCITNLQTQIVTCCIRIHIHLISRIPFPFLSF